MADGRPDRVAVPISHARATSGCPAVRLTLLKTRGMGAAAHANAQDTAKPATVQITGGHGLPNRFRAASDRAKQSIRRKAEADRRNGSGGEDEMKKYLVMHDVGVEGWNFAAHAGCDCGAIYRRQQ